MSFSIGYKNIRFLYAGKIVAPQTTTGVYTPVVEFWGGLTAEQQFGVMTTCFAGGLAVGCAVGTLCHNHHLAKRTIACAERARMQAAQHHAEIMKSNQDLAGAYKLVATKIELAPAFRILPTPTSTGSIITLAASPRRGFIDFSQLSKLEQDKVYAEAQEY